MKIKTKKELAFVLQADRMMNRGSFKPSLKDKLLGIIFPDYIMDYLCAMRKVSYYHENMKNNKCGILLQYYYKWKWHRLGRKLGFSIAYDSLGYGVVIPHYGTIVVGGSNQIGNYAVLHTSTCITSNGKQIGEGLYLSAGAKIIGKLTLGNNISIGANSLVNKSYEGNNAMIGGMLARFIKESEPWYIRDGEKFYERVQKIENLKQEYEIF